VVLALGITWVLDGLEVTITGAIAGALKSSPVLHLSDAQAGLAASCYLAGAVCGALLFGWLTDKLGRKRLFNVTLGLYLVATALTAFSPDFLWFAFFRALTGAGIGGEYAAINSAIQELIPARHRGHTDLVVNGSFWIGAALGAVASVLLLDPHLLPEDLGWRYAFGLGAALGTIILWLRRWVPESPRRLVLHDRIAEAERILGGIECRAGAAPILEPLPYLHLRARKLRLADVARSLLRDYPRRTAVTLELMATQAFFYNAIFFTYAGESFPLELRALAIALFYAFGTALGRGRTEPVRRADRQRCARRHCAGLPAGRGADAGRRSSRGVLGNRRGTTVAGRRGRTAFAN